MGVCVPQTGPSALELSEATALSTRGYHHGENVFAPGYQKPVVGHWVTSDATGNEKWMGGDEYVAAYGTDDPAKGQFLGHSKLEISQAPSL